MTFKKVLKKTGKIFLYIIGSILILLVCLWFFLKTDYAKNLIRDKVQAYLVKKIKTNVTIGSINYSLPDWITIKDVYIPDEKKDTLLFAGEAYINIQMLKLISGEISINKISLDSIRSKISRSSNDSNFNFQFIVNAFAGNKDSVKVKPADTSAMKITLKEISIKNSSIQLKDNYGGSDMSTTLKNLDITMDKFQPDRFIFDINKLKAEDLDVVMTTYEPGNTDTKPKVATDTSQKNNLQVAFKNVDMRNVNVLMTNKINGLYYSNSLNHFTADNAGINMATSKIALDDISLDNSFIKFIAAKAEEQKTVSDTVKVTPTAWTFQLKSVKMNNDSIQFDDNNKPVQKEGLDPSHLDVQNINVNVGDIFYTSDSIKAVINQFAFKEKSGFVLDSTHVRIFYSSKDIAAAELYIKTPQSLIQNSVEVKYDDVSQIMTNPGQTSIDVNLDKTVIAVNDLYTLMPFVKKYLPEEKFRNNNISLNTKITGTLKELSIPFLRVQGFSGSMINAKATLYNVTDSEKLGYDIYVFNSHILKSDMVKFTSGKNVNDLPPSLDLSTHLKGDLKNTTADILFSSNALKINGKVDIKNLKDPKKLQYNIALKQAMVKKEFILAFAPKNSLPSSIELPELITLTGSAKGDMNNVDPNLVLGGSYGTVSAKGYIHNFKNKSAATYDLQLSTKEFAAGRLLKNDSVIGDISMNITAKGRGLDYKTMSSSFDVEIQNALFRKYPYKDISVKADLNGGQLKTNGSINSDAIQLQYDASANLSGEYPKAVDAVINLDTIELQKLGLYKDTLNAAFKALIKAADLDPKNLNASLLIDSTRLNVRSKPYALDSIKLMAVTNNGNHTIDFTSPFIIANADGKFDYDKIGQSVLQYIDRFYNVTNEAPQNISPQSIAFKGVIKDHPMIADLTNGLAFDDIHFDGKYASGGGDSALQLNVALPKLTYQNYLLNNTKLNVSSLNKEIDYAVSFDQLRLNKNIYYATTIKGDLANDSLNITALTKNVKNKDWFLIGAGISNKNKAYSVSLKDNLILNYEKWNVDPTNRIDYSDQGILANHFILTKAKKKISIESKENKPNSPIDINIENFPIEDVLAIANSDTLLASGDINAKMTVSNLENSTPGFDGTVAIDQLKFKQQPIGYIKFSAKKQDDNAINIDMSLSGNRNSLNGKGIYYLDNRDNQFDIDLKLDSLNMATLQAFSGGNLTRSSGNINGQLKLNGNFSEPHWNGDIDFDSTKFTITKTGATYSIAKQKIVLAYPEIQLDKFTINDSTNNSLTIDGSITAQSMTEYDLSLDMHADNFIVVNSPQSIDNQVYGFAAADADVSIDGSTTKTDIEGDISLNKKSDVTLVLPEQNINKDEAKNVVRFIDRDTFELPEKVAFTPAGDTTGADKSQFLNYNLNLSINKEATLTVIIDPTTGDELKVKGDAKLNAGVDPGGNIVLAGNYELESGHYIMSYQFLQREFNLVKGSTIAFSGSPTNAEINITAEYIANTSASDLLVNQVSETDPATLNSFNQKIPFKVLLYLKGTMKKPDISFDIEMPDEKSNIAISSELRSTIENKLSQMRSDVAVVNKEVFSLLLLGHFVSEQSSDFFKSSGTSASAGEIAKESVSKYLSSALNEIASDLFKGVDVDLNLNSYEDFSSGSEQQKTDLNVAVSKNFLNDRLTVTAGKNFGVEGEDAGAKAVQQNSTTSSFPDVTLNYKLTKDGKYLLRAYKKDQFEVTVDGYVVETGVGFILTMDYDKFYELFHKKKRNKTGKH